MTMKEHAAAMRCGVSQPALATHCDHAMGTDNHQSMHHVRNLAAMIRRRLDGHIVSAPGMQPIQTRKAAA